MRVFYGGECERAADQQRMKSAKQSKAPAQDRKYKFGEKGS